MTRVPAFSKRELPALLTAGAYALLLLAGSIHARSLAGGLTAVLLVCGFLCGRFARKGKAVSLVAETRDGKNSFRVKIAPPEGKSFAREIAVKYGVTYEALVDGGQ